MQWDLFCRVIDNFGDLGVCWRLAADLASRGESVRLWVDDASALAWMAPGGAAGVAVRPWPLGAGAVSGAVSEVVPGQVVVEAFGCELPQAFLQCMADAPNAPCWINLEYLSAEAYVERAHKLVSPQLSGAGAGLRKWFFYPGFTTRTGGLLREPGLAQRRARFDPSAWLHGLGASRAAGERVVSLFCYEAPALPDLLDRLAAEPTLLLATTGHAWRQVTQALGTAPHRGHLRARRVPELSQTDYDHLLWSSDVNFVRGEDSFVRAQWAGAPFVWQIYPQEDGVHLAKLQAFLDRCGVGPQERALWQAWNGAGTPLPDLPALAPWRTACREWRDSLLAQTDLTTQLLDFVAETR